MNKSLFGLGENIVAALCYVLGCIPVLGCVAGFSVLILERENKYVRFHALQATLFGLAVLVLGFVLNIVRSIPIIGFVGGIASWALGVVTFVAVIYLVFTAFKGQTFKLPIIGDISWEQVNK